MVVNHTSVEKALQMIKKARLSTIIKGGAASAFFGSLLFELEPVADDVITNTMATDGEKLYFSASFVCGALADERNLKGVLIHEALHVALGHMARLGGRDHELWNVATDLSINQLVMKNAPDGNWALPHGVLFPSMFNLPADLHADQYYSLLSRDTEKCKFAKALSENGAGVGQVVPGKKELGESEGEAQSRIEKAWRGKVAMAAARASARGTVPGDVRRLIDNALAPKVDWRRVLADFMSQAAKDERAWHCPSRRYSEFNFYVPGPYGIKAGPTAVAVDTSGSISYEQLRAFAGEISAQAEATGGPLYLCFHDHKVQHVQRYAAEDGPLRLEAKGGGGTSHVPVFEWLEEFEPEEGPFECVVGLSDMLSLFPNEPPDLQVLWAVYGNSNPKVPFGTAVHVE